MNITIGLAALAFLTMGLIKVNSRGEAPSTESSAPALPPMDTGTEVGDKVPNIVLENPDGKKLELYKLIRKDRLILIDFWASWCRPCRQENPALVAAYEKYQDASFKDARGFEIFSVSLDTDKERWKKAIEQDNLEWKYHVSDLGGWNSQVAKQFGVRSIPHSILVNSEGIIVAKNLRGRKLHTAVDEFVESF